MSLRAQFVIAAAALLLSLVALVPARADAKVMPHLAQVSAHVPARIWQQIGFVPTRGMETTVPPFKVRAGKHIYRGMWANALASRTTLTESLREIRGQTKLGYSVTDGVFADRALTRREKRNFQVLADFARDADVLVAKAGHPACSGLTLAQVRAIATGRMTSWSAAAADPGGGADRIALRHVVRDGMFEARFGANRKPSAAKGRADGGVADAARDASVAAITAWSRFSRRSDVCAVPIDGVAPSDVTVHNLSYRGAFPISFVAPKRRSRGVIPRTEMRIYVRYLKSAAAAKLFRQNGLLMKADTPEPETTQPGPGSEGGPSMDAQARPISPTRDDAGALAALEGERLEQSSEPGYTRLAFEPGSVVNVLESGDGTTCTMSGSGRWTVIEGWRYSEYGGGFVIRLRFEFEQISDATIELVNDPPATAYYDGQTWSRSRALAGSC